MPLDNKISNIIGVRAPEWVLNQLNTRSTQNSQSERNNDNLLYLANKTAWIRLVSSVDITEEDLRYFQSALGDTTIKNASDLSKQFVLFGGTSIYLNKDSYQLRYGLSGISPNQAKNGSYGMLGREEIQRYGYKPMPGITSATIETQGRLGSVKAATIQFKCWDKAQLDIIDALYFKLGYTMFLEWGHTYYYPSYKTKIQDRVFEPGKVYSTEFFSIDPFDENLRGNKEEIFRRIARNSRDSEGNYDGMLGIATNFNFSYNQEGGYDCTLKIIALGYLTDYIKINNPESLPNLLKEEVKQYNSLLEVLRLRDESLLGTRTNDEDNFKKATSIFAYINTKAIQKGELKPEYGFAKSELEDTFFEPVTPNRYKEIIIRYGIANSDVEESIPEFTNGKFFREYLPGPKEKYDFIYDDSEYTGPTLYVQKYGIRIPEENTQDYISSLTIDSGRFRNILTEGAGNVDFIVNYYFQENLKNTLSNNLGTGVVESYKSPKIPYFGLNDKVYLVSFEIDLNDDILNIFESTPNVNYVIVGGNKKIEKFSLQDNLLKELLKVFIFGTNNLNTEFTGGNDFSFGGSFNDNYELSIPKITRYSADSGNQILKKERNFLDSAGAIKDINYVNNQTSGNAFELSVLGTYQYALMVSRNKPGFSNEIAEEQLETFSANYKISITDTSLITSIIPTPDKEDLLFLKYTNDLEAQNKIEETKANQTDKKSVSEDQENSPLYSMSTIESMLRTIQLYSLNEAITESGTLDLGLIIRDIKMANNKSFIKQLFSVGIFQNCIENLIKNEIEDSNYDLDSNLDADYRFKVHAKYGFATNLMANKEKLYYLTNSLPGYGSIGLTVNSSFTPVNYSELLTTYVIPYEKSQNIEDGTPLNHPVYIQFGTLLMLLNHSCTLYDPTGKVQTPIVYIDFNPNHNFCLTNPQQLSTDPFTALIPFEGTDDDYISLFNSNIINEYTIAALSGPGEQATPLFRPKGGGEDNRDYVSPSIPKFRAIEDNKESLYKGRIMNVLLNIDYIMGIIKSYSLNNEENKVFLKPLLEKILTDINKSLGNINVLRLSYNDSGNVLQIVDDQIIPAGSKERLLYLSAENNAELPLVGKNSIAKSLDIKTEISTRLSNMIAISSNSITGSKSTLSTSGDNFGFININYKDRYIENKTEVNGANQNSNTDVSILDAEKRAAIQFNKAIKSFYSSPYPAEDQIPFSTNYFINKLTKVKGNAEPTRASSMIPVSVNLTTDGISGFSMGHAFTIPNELLPYTYSARKLPGGRSFLDRVGFVVVGLNHTIENNTWNTSLRASMIFLKNPDVYTVTDIQRRQKEKFFNSRDKNGKTPRSESTPNADALRVVLGELGYKEKGKELANWGDITPAMAKLAENLFREIKKKYPIYKIEVTGGNDEYHQTSISYTSSHIYGNGIDFQVIPENQAIINSIANIVSDFSRNNSILGFKNEYNDPSLEATAGHFHIFVKNS